MDQVNGDGPAPAEPAPPRLAASLIVVRDAPGGLEVLLVRRADRREDMGSGAFVFPGGVVDELDRRLHERCAGLDAADADRRLSVDAHGLDFYVCAIRECFEEAGLLFARGEDGEPIRLEARERDEWRRASFERICDDRRLRLAVDRLAYHGHWVTPPGLPRRFDTRFFLAVAPQGQTASHDGAETVAHLWLRPAEALDPARGFKLLPATRHILKSLAGFDRAEACFEHAQGLRDIPRVMPRLARSRSGVRPVLPAEPSYAEIERIDPLGRGTASCEIEPGVAVRLSERVLRVTAPNGGIMTGPGTNTYLVGGERNEWAVIDPGPDDERHARAVLAAAPGPIRWILVTHTHEDHSPGVARLKAATGAPSYGRTTPHPHWQDPSFRPDHVPGNGDRLALGGATLRVLHTPGHASNHLCYLLEEERTLFTGDHVIQGSTVVIDPPDGDMAAYLASLSALLEEDLEWLAPGHGFLIARPHEVIRGLIRHRLEREAKVVRALDEIGPAGIGPLLERVYDDVPRALHAVAERSLLAHLLKLAAEGRAVETDGRWQAAQDSRRSGSALP